MAEDDHFPLLIDLGVISIQGGVPQYWHFDLEEERDDEFEHSERYKSPFCGVNKEDIIQILTVFLCRDPFPVLAV